MKVFDYHHMSKSPAVFDIQKLKWMNGEYMKAMDEDKFYEMALPYIKQVITIDLDLKIRKFLWKFWKKFFRFWKIRKITPMMLCMNCFVVLQKKTVTKMVRFCGQSVQHCPENR